ncbi:MAG: copper resistance protein NlpE N-terminal domain-containing protein [Gammaproteobacteria bacterium]|nr:copper resistance protein NlpE N-terminal domain-containing protein [Gammaproteobacteria bacterium]
MNHPLILLVIVLVGGCSDDGDSDSPEELPKASLPGVYAGVFPCEGCPGITSTLWLRSDGRFFFRQQYPEDNVREAMDAYSIGRWSSIDDDRGIELSGSGPRRTFMRLDRDTLVMRTHSDLEHRLTRDSTTADLSATIRMEGTMRTLGDSVSFTECLTGFVAPVSRGGDFARFRHQYRSADRRSEPTYVELEGRFSWSGDGSLKSLIIERFITVKANGAC